MAKDFEIIQIDIDKELLMSADRRLRSQIAGCMNAHNELTVLNRLLMFSMNDTGDGELHNSAKSVQMWFVLQLLAGKLFEAWVLVTERFLRSNPPEFVDRLESEQSDSLKWLAGYFGDGKPFKNNALKIIRDKTAFHYDQMDLNEASAGLAAGESSVYLAQHPANSLYYMGSAIVFRTAFAMISDRADETRGQDHRHGLLVDGRNEGIGLGR